MIISKKKYFIICILSVLVLPGTAQDLTYNKDIYPLIQTKCAPCHQPGEAAPFSLLTYEDVSKRASFIKKVLQSRYMPPWRADNSYSHFANDRSLTDEQIALITKWIDEKAPQANGVEIKPASKLVTGTLFGRKPDLVLQASDTFHVSGDNIERFIIFKIPFELKDSANVEAIEFISSNKKLIHHANYAIHAVPDEKIDLKSTASFINLTDDDRTKFNQYQPYRKTIAYYGGWIPGTSYEYFPERIRLGYA